MRRAVKVLSNLLGAAKELTGQYVELAEITEDEQNQIRISLMDRPDRKATAKLLAAKGLSTYQIAEITGWSPSAIQRDLRVIKDEVASSDAASASDDATGTGGAETIAHREEVAAAAAEEGVTDRVRRHRIRVR